MEGILNGSFVPTKNMNATLLNIDENPTLEAKIENYQINLAGT
jgi:hypothetical protein